METRALARLAGHKFIIDGVQSFRNKYPDWKMCISDLLNELGAKYRAKKKPNKTVKTNVKTNILTKNNKTIKNVEFEDAQSVSEDVQSESEDARSVCEVAQYESEDAQSLSEDDLYQSESEGSQHEQEEVMFKNATKIESYTDINKSVVTSDETNTEISLAEKMLPEENNTSSEDQNNESKDSILLNSNNKQISTKKEECLSTFDKSVRNSLVNVLKTQISKKNILLSTNESLDNTDVELDKNVLKRKSEQSFSSRVEYKKKRNTVNEIKPVCETVDSFFMTTDNKDYMSVYKPPPVTEKNNEERIKIDYQQPTKDYQKPAREFFSKGKKVIIGKQNNMGNRRERRQQQVEETVDTALHPSWEAKRKQKSLAKFEGKKITFDDQD